MTASHHQVLILGGGFTGSLIALALMRSRPEIDFLLVEQSNRFGGGLVLPFFLNSVPLRRRELIEPLIVRQWSGYYVAGQGFSTSLPGVIAYLVPEQLHVEIVEKILAHRLLPGARIARVDGDRVILGDGRELDGTLILDARGRSRVDRQAAIWRHVHSRHLCFAGSHDLDRPILIDASFPQSGWSFLQYFPLDPLSLLIQSVAYSTSSAAPSPACLPAGDDGRLLAQGSVSEPVHDGPSGDMNFNGGNEGVPVCAFNVAPWNPAMSSVVASAILIAATIADAHPLSRDGILESLGALAARAADSTGRMTHPPVTLTDVDIGTRLSALCHFWVP